MKPTHELLSWTLRLKFLQSISTFIKAVTQILLRNGMELLQYLTHQQEQHQKQKWKYSRTIFVSFQFLFLSVLWQKTKDARTNNFLIVNFKTFVLIIYQHKKPSNDT